MEGYVRVVRQSTILIVTALRNLGLVALLDRLSGTTNFASHRLRRTTRKMDRWGRSLQRSSMQAAPVADLAPQWIKGLGARATGALVILSAVSRGEIPRR